METKSLNGITSLRWWTKKLARTAVALAGAPAAALGGIGPTRVYALTYHRFGSAPRDPFCVTPHDFESQVRSLAEQERAVSLDDIEAFVRGERALPNQACLITIDDGMVSTFEHALPILTKYRAPAALFVSSSLVGRTIHGAEEPYMSWQQLREVAQHPGISIGSHAHSHRSLGAMDAIEARSEMETSRQVLEGQLGHSVKSFAYPFGTIGDFDERTDAALREAGYSIAFNSIHGSIRAGMHAVSLPRIKVEGGESQRLFELVSRGATAPWQVVDRNLWRFQRVRAERI